MIQQLTQKELKNQNKDLLVNVIYNNFINLADDPKLNHTKKEITKTLSSNDVVLFLIIDSGKIIAYLLAEIIKLKDTRKVTFISYIYVIPSMRQKKLGCKLMSLIINYAITQRCDGVMLIYNTSDRKLERFYDKYGFMLDFHLRRYEKHDVYYKILP
jgi:ribosomal protein S18 acetylase RimI-like enzyme